MANGKFKIINIDNLTTEQVKGKLFHYKNDFTPIGTLTHADENYIYGELNHYGELVFKNNKCSMEYEVTEWRD